jgi:two-component system response regulator AtoC
LLGLLTFELYSTEKEALLEQKNEQIQYFLKHQLAEPGNFYVSISPKMQAIYKAISLILDNDITVLLEGESGTGKDIFASLIHLNSKRKNKPLIVLNCGAIPKELIESELFGHEKGSFTGATERQLGKFELAEDGTIFLDEISELNIDLQVKLLRVLQNKELQRIGGKEKIKINARVIAATNKDLKKEVETKKFRLDLYYRLNVFPLLLPPLRERKEDIVPLAQFFLKKYAPQYNQQVKEISLDAQFYLQNQTWEGNIRELENIMQRAILLAESPILTVEVFKHIPGQQPQNLLPHQNIENLKLIPEEIIPLAEIEKQTLQKALELTNGNIRKAAQNLKISRTTFYNKLKKYNISLQ